MDMGGGLYLYLGMLVDCRVVIDGGMKSMSVMWTISLK